MSLITAEQLQIGEKPAVASLARCAHTARITIANITVEVRTDIPDLARSFHLHYIDHGTVEPPDFVYYILQTPDGYVFWSEHTAAFHWNYGELSTRALVFLCDAVVPSAVICFDGALTSMHAAALTWAGRGVAIAGDTTAGKTTTFLAAARLGMKMYSDERALLRNGTLHPFLRRCKPREGSTKLLLADDDNDALAYALRSSAPFSLVQCFGEDAVAKPASLDAILLLDGYAPSTYIERVDSVVALRAIGRWFSANGNLLQRLARARSLVRALPCYRLTLGSPRDAARTMMEFCESADAAAV